MGKSILITYIYFYKLHVIIDLSEIQPLWIVDDIEIEFRIGCGIFAKQLLCNNIRYPLIHFLWLQNAFNVNSEKELVLSWAFNDGKKYLVGTSRLNGSI